MIPIRALSSHVATPHRRGTLLIIVAGISALLMSMAMVFLINMRSDVEESNLLMQEAQARLVLIAGLQYIQEASRLGWDSPLTPEHEEAFGWADVRDGSAGPKDRNGVPLYEVGSGRFPDIGGKAARFPLFVMERPPFALKQSFVYNPLPMRPADGWNVLVNYTERDPQPAGDTWIDFATGKPAPRPESLGKSWMRIYRDKNPPPDPSNPNLSPPVEPATFTITCGAGPTAGFRDYAEVIAEGETEVFQNDRALFNFLRSQETILWFRAQWTSAVGGSGMGIRIKSGYYELPEINKESYFKSGSYDVNRNTPTANSDHHWWVNRNPIGSILWIQRLEQEPAEW